MMLEDIAIQYVSQTEGAFRLINYGLAILGAVVAGIFVRGKGELQRAPYFAYFGLLFLIVAATQLVWLNSLPAMAGGYLWVLMTVDVITSLVGGYFLAVIAVARARDAYGDGRWAALAFIPIWNFWLLLTRSKNEASANRIPTLPLLTGGLGVLCGFVMLAASIALSAYIRTELEQRIAIAEAQSDPEQQSTVAAFLIRSQGLEAALRQMAAEVPIPYQVDETTILRRVEGQGSTLRYTYETSLNIDAVPISMRTGVIQHNCSYLPLRPVFAAGATVEHVYLRRDGSEMGTVTVTKELCEF